MAKISVKSLLEAGAHFGHQTRRWNPKMKPYIFGNRGDIYILDLKQTLVGLDQAYTFVENTARKPSPLRLTAAACLTSTLAGSAACSPTS